MNPFQTTLLILFSFFSLLLGAACAITYMELVDLSKLDQFSSGKPTIVLDDQGVEWARFELDKREPISVAEIPEHVIHAFLAAEDWNFFSHYGISPKGIVRSLVTNLLHGRIVQGASTITQQLVKLLFTNSERSFSRKLKELFYAWLVELHFSKEQILQSYLNHTYFGCGIYGIQAASQRFWNKPASQLDVAQAACLAGIVQHPAQYCPLLNPLSAQHRRNTILGKMRKLNWIDELTLAQHMESPLELCSPHKGCIAPHLKESLRQFLEQKLGKTALYTNGFTVQTTINRTIQQEASQQLTNHLKLLSTELKLPLNGALLSMESATGQIKAVVGGTDGQEIFFNRAFQARRQMGSVFKPLIFAQALLDGYHFHDTEVDEPIELPTTGDAVWRPQNYNKKFEGPMTLAYALSHSSNIIPIKLLLKLNIQKVVNLAHACQLRGPVHPYPSLALGCVDVTVLETVGMFNVFARHGAYIEPHVTLWIKDQWGAKIWRKQPIEHRVLPAQIADRVARVLELGLKRIRKWYEKSWIFCQAISKTGTTNDSRTCWLAGSTPYLTTALYVGTDDNRPMGKHIYPVKTAFPIWLGLNRAVPQPTPTFSYHPQLKPITIDERSGAILPASSTSPNAITVFQ